jgi:hypothetical protein
MMMPMPWEMFINFSRTEDQSNLLSRFNLNTVYGFICNARKLNFYTRLELLLIYTGFPHSQPLKIPRQFTVWTLVPYHRSANGHTERVGENRNPIVGLFHLFLRVLKFSPDFWIFSEVGHRETRSSL